MSITAPFNETRPAAADAPGRILDLLTDAYLMEIETVMNYVAASTNLDGFRGRQVADVLAAEVDDELGHARRFAERIKELGGTVPGSARLAAGQRSLQPPVDSADVDAVIAGVLDAEREAVAAYTELARAADGSDYVTHDLAVEVLADEERHRRMFEGLLGDHP